MKHVISLLLSAVLAFSLIAATGCQKKAEEPAPPPAATESAPADSNAPAAEAPAEQAPAGHK